MEVDNNNEEENGNSTEPAENSGAAPGGKPSKAKSKVLFEKTLQLGKRIAQEAKHELDKQARDLYDKGTISILFTRFFFPASFPSIFHVKFFFFFYYL
jgi:hypothetical protein